VRFVWRKIRACLRPPPPPAQPQSLNAHGFGFLAPSELLKGLSFVDADRMQTGSQFSDLLEKSGVDSVVELSKRLPDNLYKKMQDVNKAKNLVNAMPGLKKVKGWISQAKKMKRVITY
jgi:hypothetical protein